MRSYAGWSETVQCRQRVRRAKAAVALEQTMGLPHTTYLMSKETVRSTALGHKPPPYPDNSLSDAAKNSVEPIRCMQSQMLYFG